MEGCSRVSPDGVCPLARPLPCPSLNHREQSPWILAVAGLRPHGAALLGGPGQTLSEGPCEGPRVIFPVVTAAVPHQATCHMSHSLHWSLSASLLAPSTPGTQPAACSGLTLRCCRSSQLQGASVLVPW